MTIQGSFHLTPQDVLKAMRIIESKKLPLKKLITREARLDEIVEMFDRIRQGKELKVAIRF